MSILRKRIKEIFIKNNEWRLFPPVKTGILKTVIDMTEFENLEPPSEGEKIEMKNGNLVVPDHPIIPYIEGDGIGPDITKAAHLVFNAAVEKAYEGKRKVVWFKVYAGDEAIEKFHSHLTKEEILNTPPDERQKLYMPDDTLKALKEYIVSIKGPLTTPVGGGIRSLNVTFRQKLDLYACVRPVFWLPGTPSPVRNPEKLDVVIFRENTEDIYAGIEWKRNESAVEKIYQILKEEDKFKKVRFPNTANIGLKPTSEEGSKRLVRAAIKYAIQHQRRSVTLVHKGNIMKFTEGMFKNWGYEVAKEEFRDYIITEDELWDQVKGPDGVTPTTQEGAFAHLRNGRPAGDPGGRIVIKDRITDAMFQQLLLRPDEYDVIATMNLNGDYLSDACAAQVGGLGMAPGANINYDTGIALFEATHGTAPKYRNMDKVNPGSLILSGAMMFEYLGWKEVADMIKKAIGKTIKQKRVTYDLHRQMEGATKLKTSEFAKAIVENMDNL